MVLSNAFNEFGVECYNGDFLSPSSIPTNESCAEPLPCDLTKFTETRKFMETTANLSATIDHGEMISYFCKDDKTLNPVKDPDGNNLFTIECNNGEMIKEIADWPEENEV